MFVGIRFRLCPLAPWRRPIAIWVASAFAKSASRESTFAWTKPYQAQLPSPGPNMFFGCEAPALGQLKGHHCVVSASCCFLYRVPRQDFGQIHTYFTGVKISPHVQYSMVPNPTRRSRTRQSCSERRRHQRHSRGIHLSIQSVLRLPDMLLPPPAMHAEFTTHSVGIRLKLVGDEASDVSR